jgi:predicted Zn finger-like uncharacterized protein
MRFVCDSCRAQYMISDEKVGAKGVKVRCKKCGYVILVRRPQDVPPPPLMDEPSDATQVMQNPLGEQPEPESKGFDPEATAPEEGASQVQVDKLFGGVDEDEIGAVFDQVLTSGKHKSPTGDLPVGGGFGDEGGGALGDDSDDRMSTRVLDSEIVKKLAREAAGDGSTPSEASEPDKAPEPEPNDWFVAIEDKQIGPLDLDKIKEHWERGEIGPDSLCWRAGFSDWMPLSEVAGLAAVLAPQPKKPVIVAPVESGQGASTSGGRSGRGEAPASRDLDEDDGGWKPSAASALASLVKEEIEALARPPEPPKPEPVPEPEPEKRADRPMGILDLPSQEHSVPQAAGSSRVDHEPASEPRSRAVRSAALGAQSDAPSYTSSYRSPSAGKTSKAIIYGGGAAVVVLLLLIGTVVWLVLRQQDRLEEIARKPLEVPVVVAKAEVPAAPAAEPAKAPEEAKTEPAEQKVEPAVEKKEEPSEVARREAAEPRRTSPSAPVARREPEPRREPASAPVARREVEPKSEGNDDDFDAMFGTKSAGAKKAAETKKEAPSRAVYVPPAPGQADIPDKLGQSDIMQVVLANRPAILNCVGEQKTKDPGASGTLVMRWTIRTNGSTTGIVPQTAEYKNSHLATCMTGQIRGWKFPAHKTQGAPIDFPFKF